MMLPRPGTAPPEFGTGYGRGHGYIEGLAAAVAERRYEQLPVRMACRFPGYPIGLGPHDYHDGAIRRKVRAVNILAVQESAEYRNPFC